VEVEKMADFVKKRARKSRTSKLAPKADEAIGKIVLVNVQDTPQYYANYMEVSHNPHEFEMFFARLPARIDSEQLQNLKITHAMQVEPLVRVIIPTSLISDVIRVLQDQHEKFQAKVQAVENKDVRSKQ
jgi:hypothetical protein